MKLTSNLLALLVVAAVFAGCTTQTGEESPTLPGDDTAGTQEPAVTPTEETQALSDIDSTIVDENSEVEIGEMI
ncbi:MAG: hypothetical protein QS98_C0007G0010 [archaeon GW2011_AR3]|nr:MAG: hypothetical protein QS98_C0007G0010 [archaeon GW2011_AR3]MBS3108921.1 hypothetical protein [Candidatus Woesearchaeota archaeon]